MISIITAVHNQLNMNKVFYENLKKYTYYDFELIIVDNASNDGSREYFEEMGVKIIKNEHNYSYPYTQNQGIKIAKNEYLGFLNNDIIVSKHWDKNLIDTLEKNQLDAITVSGIERLENKAVTKRLRLKWSFIKNILGFFSKSKTSIELMHKLMYPNWEKFTTNRFNKFKYEIKEGFVGNTVLFKKSLIDKIGYWDERVQSADFDLYFRLKDREKSHKDVKPLSYALGVYNHHYIKFTLNSGNYPPFYDMDNHITIEEKWGDKTKYLQEQEW